jgi:hypothetical protein
VVVQPDQVTIKNTLLAIELPSKAFKFQLELSTSRTMLFFRQGKR